MRRLAIFAHYDSMNFIDKYVIYYLKELKKVSDLILFVSDSDVSKKEIKKLHNIADVSIIGKHNEYDFGSYKRGVLYALDNDLLHKYDELIFCNDSCFGPISKRGFSDLFETMNERNADFWGITINNFGLKYVDSECLYIKDLPHIQTFFIVFRKSCFLSICFIEFMKQITQKKKQDIVIQYEIGLTKMLRDNNFTMDSYIPFNENEYSNPKIFKVSEISKNDFYFLKKTQHKELIGEKLFLYNYPQSMIYSYSKRVLGINYYKIFIYNKYIS